MSVQQGPSGSSEEMDLTDVFSLFQRMFYKFLSHCFKGVDFVFKFWWVILLLIIGGASLGYFTKPPQAYESKVIVRSNFNTQPYLYNAIKQFDENLSESDAAFITSVGLDTEAPTITGVVIEPVVDVIGLVESLKVSDRTLGTIIKELEVDEETELFASDRFYSNYKYHKLYVDLASEDAKKDIVQILNYVNELPIVKKIKESGLQNLQERIKQNESIMMQSDLLIENYAKNADISNQVTNDNLAYYNNQNNLNINGILTFKNELAIETEKLKNDSVIAYDAVVVVSDLQTVKKSSLKDKKELLYPIALVFLFFLIAGIRYTYKTLREAVESELSLD